jgi:tetratricopeptide (TPR) repeat protein
VGCVGYHWTHARLLLDAVRPDPGKDPAVRLWYQATIAHLLESYDYANADPQIEHCRQLFPADPGILFQHGLYHEAFASPLLQAAAQDSTAGVRSAAAHLQEAADLFGRAIKANAGYVEARVHRGHVLGALGRFRESADELRQAAAGAQGSRLRYYTELFLGFAEESLGNRDAAREHYARASELYPMAQSPRLALSLLARQRGDRTGALGALQQMPSLPLAGYSDADPWWDYVGWSNLGSKALFAELYGPYAGGGVR